MDIKLSKHQEDDYPEDYHTGILYKTNSGNVFYITQSFNYGKDTDGCAEMRYKVVYLTMNCGVQIADSINLNKDYTYRSIKEAIQNEKNIPEIPVSIKTLDMQY